MKTSEFLPLTPDAHNKENPMTIEEARDRVAILLQHAHAVMSNETRKELNECMKVLDPNFDPTVTIQRVTE